MPAKPLSIAVVMDPIDDIKPHKDTTLAMLLAAQRRGWEISYLELGHIWLGMASRWAGRTRSAGARRPDTTGSRAATP